MKNPHTRGVTQIEIKPSFSKKSDWKESMTNLGIWAAKGLLETAVITGTAAAITKIPMLEIMPHRLTDTQSSELQLEEFNLERENIENEAQLAELYGELKYWKENNYKQNQTKLQLENMIPGLHAEIKTLKRRVKEVETSRTEEAGAKSDEDDIETSPYMSASSKLGTDKQGR